MNESSASRMAHPPLKSRIYVSHLGWVETLISTEVFPIYNSRQFNYHLLDLRKEGGRRGNFKIL